MQIVKITVEPNAQGLEHTHTADEWVYILDGSMLDSTGEYKAGFLLFNSKGSRHAVRAGPDGYEILVFFRGKSDANPHLSAGYQQK
ncbi:cupin domain-containing protein [Candidatus Woesearchaeota archaeon]|nr:cupin domain-containing protein [Candidatus Woesearchaeota archaeon]